MTHRKTTMQIMAALMGDTTLGKRYANPMNKQASAARQENRHKDTRLSASISLKSLPSLASKSSDSATLVAGLLGPGNCSLMRGA